MANRDFTRLRHAVVNGTNHAYLDFCNDLVLGCVLVAAVNDTDNIWLGFLDGLDGYPEHTLTAPTSIAKGCV